MPRSVYLRFDPDHRQRTDLPLSGFRLTPNHPVGDVSWERAKEMCAFLEERCGLPFRLPRDSEFEYSAGPWSGAWTRETSDRRPQPVATNLPNAYGLYDLLGNIEEWCEDVARDPNWRSCRGGSFANSAEWCRASARTRQTHTYHLETIGFRPAFSLR
jgi:formylglycine-generating enzyme required for sulfatase activity